MKKFFTFVLALTLALAMVPAAAFAAGSGSFVPAPETAYAQSFIDACEGQQWLLDYTEKLLNARQKSINTLASSADLDFITTLGFADQNLTGKVPAAIGEFTQLKYLFLSGNQLFGELPSSLFTLPHLVNIDLGGNAFAGVISASFGDMPSLEILNLEDNAFTGSIPDKILSNSAIRFLGLGGNSLTGGIPAGLSSMSSLEYLDLSENDLQGTIPDLSSLTNLKVLSLWNCGLTGEIPSSLWSLTDLQILDLAGNHLSGDPLTSFAGLSALTSLKIFTADGNAFRGTLPDSFPASLETVHLENNVIRGKVPASLAAINAAGGSVFLSGNYMTGTVLKDMAAASGNTETGSLNFADGADMQYKLSFTKTEQLITSEAAVNFFPLLENKAASGTLAVKPMLKTSEYIYTYDPAKVELTVTESEVLVKALCEIKKADGVTIGVQIKDNDGSAYSAASILVHTEKPAPSYGPSGGSSSSEPESEPVLHSAFISGFSDGTFRPDNGVTREQTASMLAKAMALDLTDTAKAGDPDTSAAATESSADAASSGTDAANTSSFYDVASSRWSFAAVCAASEKGWFSGYSDGSFKPSKTITRAELATVLVKIAEAEGRVPSAEAAVFTDVSETAWYSRYVEKASAFGLIAGYSDGSFRPEKEVSRAEAVVMIDKFLGRDCGEEIIAAGAVLPETAEKTAISSGTGTMQLTVFPDILTHWAYRYILEASVSHKAEQ